MGPRLLCFAAGAALSGYFVHLGLLATPFFGSGAFLWANVFACFLLVTALGHGLGDGVARVAGRQLEMAVARLSAAGALLAWGSLYLLPRACRLILEHDPGWALAPAAAIALLALVPGTLIAAVVPSELRARVERGSDAATVARGALRLLGLFTLGGVTGVALCGATLLRADRVSVWLHAYSVPGVLALLSAPLLRLTGRLVIGAGFCLALGLSLALPSELQSEEYAVALETAWESGQGAGLYYLRTAHDDETLSEDQLKAYTDQLKADRGEKPGVILACEMLTQLGAVTVTGRGLVRSLELLLSPEARPVLLPIFEQFHSVTSDGNDNLSVQIKRTRGEDGARCRIPTDKPGEYTVLVFQDDFTAKVTREQGLTDVWRLEFGPLTVDKAGIFDLNDTHHTPIRLPDVSMWVDASLLAIVFEDKPDQLVIKAVAQGSIGDVQTVVLGAYGKDRLGGPERPKK